MNVKTRQRQMHGGGPKTYLCRGQEGKEVGTAGVGAVITGTLRSTLGQGVPGNARQVVRAPERIDDTGERTQGCFPMFSNLLECDFCWTGQASCTVQVEASGNTPGNEGLSGQRTDDLFTRIPYSMSYSNLSISTVGLMLCPFTG